jgi:hypothetical protein
MLSVDVKRKLLEGVREFSRPFESAGWGEEARRAFSNLRLEGEVRALTALGYWSSSILELAAQLSPFKRTFGLDGGSTRPGHFANGMTLCANQAVLVSEPPIVVGAHGRAPLLPLEAFRTLALVTHSFGMSGGPRADYHEEGPLGRWRIHITKDYLRGDIDHIVKGLADSASEARHALRMAERLELDQDDLLILDGNIFPIGLYYYLISKGGFRREVDLASFAGAIRVLEQHLRLTELLTGQGTAYVGINKTPQTRYLLNCLDGEVPWADDRQLIRALFHGIAKDELGWTNWFLQERYRAYLARKTAEGVDIFRELDLELKLQPQDYYVAYFFVYDPRTAGGAGSVLKVEAPQVILQQHDLEELQRAILGEIARGCGVPSVIRRADSRARITQREREALMKKSGLPPDLGYNQGRGEPW